jgi:pilus assembly protein CpaB
MRAFAVHVNEVMGVAGFAVAGMHVDILVSGVPPGMTGENVSAVTRTLLQNIQILSAGQNYQKDAEGKPVLVQVVNLLVTPEQAEVLNLATDQKIQLVLRNPVDREIVNTPGASSVNLFQGGVGRIARRAFAPGAPVPPAIRIKAEPARAVTVEVFSGSRRSEASFQESVAGVQP